MVKKAAGFWIVFFTPSVFLSAGPLNYTIRLTKLLVSIGLPVKVKILYRSRTRVRTMLSLISLILRRVSKHVFVIPYVRLEELLPILLMLPLLVLSKSRVIIVSHDVHSLYRSPGIFWKLLTILRGAYLSCLPNVYIVYVSRYSMVETLLLTKSKCIKSKGFVLYPVSKDDIIHQESKTIYVAHRDVVVFSKR